jgi:transcription elongation factor GreA
MPIAERISLTEEEHNKLQAELDELVNVKRPQIAQKIGRAAADGDLSENGAYHDAKEQQGHLEGRIQEIDYLIRNSVVVEPAKGKVGLGNTVEIKDDRGNQRTLRLVSKHGVRVAEGLISDESPLGRALMGHTSGESVSYRTPNGQERSVKILKVR